MDDYDILLKSLIIGLNTQENAGIEFCETGLTMPIITPKRPLVEFYFVDTGKISFTSGTAKALLKSGNLAITNAHFGNQGIMQTPATRYHVLSINVEHNQDLQASCQSPWLLVQQYHHWEHIETALNELRLRYHSQYGQLPGIRLKSQLLLLLIAMLDEFAQANKSPGKKQTLIQDVLDSLHRRVNDSQLNLSTLAADAGLCPDHLSRLFKQGVGATPMAYLRRIRLDRAKRLLRQSMLSIKEVSYNAGFADPLYFSRVFRRSTGVSPTTYRAESQEVSLR